MKKSLSAVLAVLLISTLASPAESGFTTLFDGKTLNGWKLVKKKGEGYQVKDGVICSVKGEAANLFTEKEYADFVLRFEFKLEDGSNNGLGIRSPLTGDAAYLGMELQILEEAGALRGKHGKLRDEQYHGSIYDLVAAKRGAMKPAGEWNTQEVTAKGRHIKVVLNGKTIVNADLNKLTDAEKLMKHPGVFRERGHIGFLGHNDYAEFRNIRIKELAQKEKDNSPPKGFKALFNGKNLRGWKGLQKPPLDNPIKRAAQTRDQYLAAQKEADDNMWLHWKVEKGEIVFDGKSRPHLSLCTTKDYGDFEMLVDWKLPARGDSGIYLRGSPQVQIWDPHTMPTKAGSEVGSGGFYNNQKHPNKPLKVADKPIGEWNRFRIVMIGEKVHVFLNGELVVNATTLENYWDRSQPIFPTGQIELQNHGDALWFKNVYIREFPAAKKPSAKKNEK
jgi:hypothetical protein